MAVQESRHLPRVLETFPMLRNFTPKPKYTAVEKLCIVFITLAALGWGYVLYHFANKYW